MATIVRSVAEAFNGHANWRHTYAMLQIQSSIFNANTVIGDSRVKVDGEGMLLIIISLFMIRKSNRPSIPNNFSEIKFMKRK